MKSTQQVKKKKATAKGKRDGKNVVVSKNRINDLWQLLERTVTLLENQNGILERLIYVISQKEKIGNSSGPKAKA